MRVTLSLFLALFLSNFGIQSCPLNGAQIPTSIEFGYLTHKKYPQVLGAVTLAVNNINEDDNILPNTTLKFKYANLANVQLEGMKKMTEFRDQGVSAFIGPDELCRNEALLASAWNLPMIAYVSIINISRSN